MNRSPLRIAALAALVAATGLLTACSATLECGSAPDEAIESFQVTVKTGDDATDADIYFCIERVSAPERDCTKLGNDLEDDFDEDSTQDYTVTTAIDAGDLARLWIENRGDAPDLSFDGDDWELDGLRVVAQHPTGSTLLVDAADLELDVDAGDEFEPDCSY